MKNWYIYTVDAALPLIEELLEDGEYRQLKTGGIHIPNLSKNDLDMITGMLVMNSHGFRYGSPETEEHYYSPTTFKVKT